MFVEHQQAYLAVKPLTAWRKKLAAVGVAILVAIGIWAVATKDGTGDLSPVASSEAASQPAQTADH